MAARGNKAQISLNRVVALVILAHGFCALLLLRLFQVQVVDRSEYIEMAKKQYIFEAELKSQRGIIYDRNLNPLAVNKRTYSIGLDNRKVTNRDSVATIFSQILGKEKSFYLNKLVSGKSFIWVERPVSDAIAAKFDSLKIPGVRVIKEERRYYPHGSLSAHVLGFTNIDMDGMSGIELAKDNDLKGNDGLALYNRDMRGNKILDIEHPVKKPRAGKNLILTINSTFQWIAEEELKSAVEKYEADAGVVIVSNPNTGEILSMAVFPDYDLNAFSRYPADKRRNRAITDVYEPGSTFKAMFMAAILEENLRKPTDIIFCENGVYRVYGREIRDVVPHGWLTLSDVIKKSSNIGMSKLAQEINRRIIYKYLRDFGFGLETGIELPGEVSGELRHYTKWTGYKQIGMAIGYGISVTPLQMVMAYGAIANGGYLLKPKICLGAFDKVTGKAPPVQPEIIRRVISDSTAKKLAGMLEQVVFDGTGKRAYIKGLRIAGKTGTAMKYDTQLGAYSEHKFVSSFVGFFPADSPQLLIFVMIDNPKKGHLGGKVAAPTFKEILKRILRFADLKQEKGDSLRSLPREDDNIKMLQLVGRRIDLVRKIARKNGWKLIEKNEGDVVAAQRFKRSKEKNTPSQLIVTLKKLGSPGSRYTFVPKVIGKTIREAVSELAKNHLKVYVRGSGKVVTQIPPPGTKMRRDARCIIECEPPISLTNFKSFE
ncbi:MAG: PASTA domain-containing protein [Calditrichaeota bacterium]|nr:PASTA domain-containing protein [Calditrichota bacterium]